MSSSSMVLARNLESENLNMKRVTCTGSKGHQDYNDKYAQLYLLNLLEKQDNSHNIYIYRLQKSCGIKTLQVTVCSQHLSCCNYVVKTL